MRRTRTQLFALILGTAVMAMACSLTTKVEDPFGPESDVKIRVAATLTQQALEEEQQAAPEVPSPERPSQTPLPSPVTPTPAPTFTPTITLTSTMAPTPSPSPSPTVVHVSTPGEPLEKIDSHVTDVSSIAYAAEGFTYGDQYLINRYERPFTSGDMDYVGHLDITLTNLKYRQPWMYFVIDLQEALPEKGKAVYGVELDIDEDGRGEFFVAASLPEGTSWSVKGVRVYRDVDGDLGGANPLFSDAPTSGLTGYERIIFDSGRGEDPDLAWARRDPEAEDRVQIAFKADLVKYSGYLWSIWAQQGPLDLTRAEYNDTWTFEEAGSPFPDHPYYPLQALDQVDSTCRSWYGLEPTGGEPGLCQMPGEGQGWNVCWTYVTGDRSVQVCENICRARCPDLPSGYSCKRCTFPSK